MKRNVFFLALVCVCSALIMAESYDTKVRNAVYKLSKDLLSPHEVSIGEIYYEETSAPSDFSRDLIRRVFLFAHEINNLRMVDHTPVLAQNRSGDSPKTGGFQKGIIKGSFVEQDVNVSVTLKLISVPGDRVLGYDIFYVPISDLNGIKIRPGDKPIAEIKEREKILNPVPPSGVAVIPGASSTLTVEAWPDSVTRTYFSGDKMTINLIASKDCYVRVDYIDEADNCVQLLFPNIKDRNNFIVANTLYSIPNPPATKLESITMQLPPGMDSVWVQVSTVQFKNIEKDFGVIKPFASGTIEETRGQVKLGFDTSGKPAESAETFFNVTVLDSNYTDEIYSYREPTNITDTIRALRSEVTQQRGTFTGNEQSGNFTYPGVQGNYRVDKNQFIISLRYTGNQFFPSPARGSAYSFTITRPKNMAQAVQTVRSGVESKGGVFSGDERQGSFRASGIAGQYSVSDSVSVSIIEKPALIPNSLIKKEVENFFTGK